jgi:hypothetical protein
MGMRRFWPFPSELLISGANGLAMAFIGGTLASEPRKLDKPTSRGKGESLSPFPVVALGGALFRFDPGRRLPSRATVRLSLLFLFHDNKKRFTGFRFQPLVRHPTPSA